MVVFFKSKYKKVGVLPIRIGKSNVIDFTIRIGSISTFLYFDLYLTLPTQHTMFISLWLFTWRRLGCPAACRQS